MRKRVRSKPARTADGFIVRFGVKYFDISNLSWSTAVLRYRPSIKRLPNLPLPVEAAGRGISLSLTRRLEQNYFYPLVSQARSCLSASEEEG